MWVYSFDVKNSLDYLAKSEAEEEHESLRKKDKL